MMKQQPTAQEFVDTCDLDRYKFLEWYNERMKELNPITKNINFW